MCVGESPIMPNQIGNDGQDQIIALIIIMLAFANSFTLTLSHSNYTQLITNANNLPVAKLAFSNAPKSYTGVIARADRMIEPACAGTTQLFSF